MSSDYRLSLIREMERSGCDLTYQASTETDTHVLTVQYFDRRFSVISSGHFDFEEAYARWKEMHKPAEVLHEVKEAPQAPRTRRTRSVRVSTCRNVPDACVREESVVPAGELLVGQKGEVAHAREGLTLRDRLKLRNEQKVGAA